jgi:hypothetical protein
MRQTSLKNTGRSIVCGSIARFNLIANLRVHHYGPSATPMHTIRLICEVTCMESGVTYLGLTRAKIQDVSGVALSTKLA